eukprot:Rmarinus@m.26881
MIWIFFLWVFTGLAAAGLPQPSKFDAQRIQSLREEVKDMFYEGYNGYLEHGLPFDELQPITCDGTNRFGGISVTMIDALDSHVLFGNYTEFRRACKWVISHVDFDKDVTVSVFETNIRVLGGLLSAHQFALNLKDQGEFPEYEGGLLDLAVDLADRLLPAFSTPTLLPFGSVNLRHGVPENETSIVATAAAGTLLIEFGMLTRYTRDPVYEVAARNALHALWMYRSRLGLVGAHIDAANGQWTQRGTGVGSLVDSYYEYLLKGYLLFGNPDDLQMFYWMYKSAMKHIHRAPWYMEVDMGTGKQIFSVFDSLQAFWPGLQTLVGDIDLAIETHAAFVSVWKQFRSLPELFDLKNWKVVPSHASYPLRPELIESTMYLHQVTKDDFYLHFGESVLRSFQELSRVKCGYSGLSNVATLRHNNLQDSFFLSETCKYLYLLFDPSNPLRSGSHVFSTEGHPFELKHSYYYWATEEEEIFGNSTFALFEGISPRMCPKRQFRIPVPNPKWLAHKPRKTKETHTTVLSPTGGPTDVDSAAEPGGSFRMSPQKVTKVTEKQLDPQLESMFAMLVELQAEAELLLEGLSEEEISSLLSGLGVEPHIVGDIFDEAIEGPISRPTNADSSELGGRVNPDCSPFKDATPVDLDDCDGYSGGECEGNLLQGANGMCYCDRLGCMDRLLGDVGDTDSAGSRQKLRALMREEEHAPWGEVALADIPDLPDTESNRHEDPNRISHDRSQQEAKGCNGRLGESGDAQDTEKCGLPRRSHGHDGYAEAMKQRDCVLASTDSLVWPTVLQPSDLLGDSLPAPFHGSSKAALSATDEHDVNGSASSEPVAVGSTTPAPQVVRVKVPGGVCLAPDPAPRESPNPDFAADRFSPVVSPSSSPSQASSCVEDHDMGVDTSLPDPSRVTVSKPSSAESLSSSTTLSPSTAPRHRIKPPPPVCMEPSYHGRAECPWHKDRSQPSFPPDVAPTELRANSKTRASSAMKDGSRTEQASE